MTANQWRMLDVLDTWGGHGTIEVEIQYGQFDLGDSDADEGRARGLTTMVVANIVRSLVKRGYATTESENGGCGYDITDAGREALRQHNLRSAKT